jgi:TRAP-type uncharacterized transport system substrate-binding protein
MLKNTLMAAVAVSALLISGHAQAQTRSDKNLGICTGDPNGYYQRIGDLLKDQLGRTFAGYHFKNTAGSDENVDETYSMKECQIAPVQGDIWAAVSMTDGRSSKLEVVAPLHDEALQIFCTTASDISNIRQLSEKKASLIVGDDGSGTRRTWERIAKADPKRFGNTVIDTIADPADVTSLAKVVASAGKKPVCMAWNAGLNSKNVKIANTQSYDVANKTNNLRIIDINDPVIWNIAGPAGPLYKKLVINPTQATKDHPGYYDHLINNGWLFGSSITVPATTAVLIMNKEASGQLPRPVRNKLTEAAQAVAGNISKEFAPD